MADESVIQTAREGIENIFKALALGPSDQARIIGIISETLAQTNEPDYEGLIDLADEDSVQKALDPLTGPILADYFTHFFPGGHPEMQPEHMQRWFIKSAVAKLKRQKANEGK
jgi:hypothetical protein